MEYAKLNFIQSLKTNYTLTDIVKHCVNERIKHNTDAYDVVTRTNVNKYNQPISSKTLLSLYKTTYDLMYDYIKNLTATPNTSQSFLILKKKFDLGEMKENPTPEYCREFFFETCPKILGDPSPLHAQNGFDPILENGAVRKDFIHIYPFELPSKIDCRLYFNTTPENSCKIGELLMKEAYKKRLRVYFKFDTSGVRNDSMLIYTNYQRVNSFVEIVENIKKTNPELFVGAENLSLLTAKVTDYIAYGEEPEYKHSSFNAERCSAIDEFIDSQIAKNRVSVGNYAGNFITSKGETLQLRDYVIYRLKTAFGDTLNQIQENLKNNNYPRNITKEKEKSYIEIQNNIFNSCKQALPQAVLQQIEAQADLIIANLKHGRKTLDNFTISFKTVKKELFSFNEKYMDDIINSRGYLEYPISVNCNIEQKLFSVLGINQQILNSVTTQNLEPYFNKHHCSTTHHYLNTETERELSSSYNL